jgi:hypothetical protein
MSGYYTKDDIANLGTLDASGANSVVFAPGRPVDVDRVIVVTTVAQTTADATITLGVRDVDNGNSVTKGSFVLPFTGSATDDVKYVNLVKPKTTATTASDGSITFTGYSPGGFIEVNPGQELFLTSDGGGDAGTYQVYVEYKDQGFSGSRIADAVELTFTAA